MCWSWWNYRKDVQFTLRDSGDLTSTRVSICIFHRLAFVYYGSLVSKKLIVYNEVDSDRQWKALLTNAEFGTREAYPACSKAKGTPVSSTVCLADMGGFRLIRLHVQRSQSFLFLCSFQYTEVLVGKKLPEGIIPSFQRLLPRNVFSFFFYTAYNQNLQRFYHTRMAKLIVINAPAAFTFVWNIAKAWLDPETREKVIILGITADSQKETARFLWIDS